MAVAQMRSQDTCGRDKFRRSASCPSIRARLHAHMEAPPDRPDRWTRRFRQDLMRALPPQLSTPAQPSHRNLFAEATARCFALSRNRKPRCGIGSVEATDALLDHFRL